MVGKDCPVLLARQSQCSTWNIKKFSPYVKAITVFSLIIPSIPSISLGL